ncbi:MAG: hypothetical protein B6I22_13750 [Desulfobacteraceae bacterium 4572_123]|nr:MAG: hypothetical protein B6I22_13750 [Desulfobacteraceae bacterium 4572_123]
MAKQTTKIPISQIILDKKIYPRKAIDPRRIGIFAENIRDGFKFEPIEVEPAPGRPGKYRLLDGAHRWSAYKSTGIIETKAVIKNLDGTDPLLYAAKKAIPDICSNRKGHRTCEADSGLLHKRSSSSNPDGT